MTILGLILFRNLQIMEKQQEPTDLLKPLIFCFTLMLVTTLIVYFFFDFEVAIIYAMSLWTAFILMGLVWLENIIIKKK